MREDYPQFQDRQAEVITIAASDLETAQDFFHRRPMPFPCLVDPERITFQRYGVASRAISLGQRPALFIIDKGGMVRFAHIGGQQWEIPSNELVLAQLDRLNRESTL